MTPSAAARRWTTRRDEQQERDERGAVLVELALIATLLLALVLGVFEIGMMWSDHQALTQSSRGGARVASHLSVRGEADVEALQAVSASLAGLDATISRVVIYEADSDGDMPAACETASGGYSGGANCNVYGTNAFNHLASPGWWGSGSSCGSADGNWCSATERSAAQSTATYLGVYVEIERNYLTGFFGGGTQTMSETTVMRLEPED